ncbi:DUF5010 domain-containing protein [Streptomyces flaveolus]|uniref:DUF5010 domain-containing protein n=1 Tax=Streptomyces flaveolus TaxID=67297 RepID=UPI00343715E6
MAFRFMLLALVFRGPVWFAPFRAVVGELSPCHAAPTRRSRPENAALFRAKEGSYSERLYDYPNQNINIMRRFSKDPFPAP